MSKAATQTARAVQTIEEGRCPTCGAHLMYDAHEHADVPAGTIEYPCECGGCGWSGLEVHVLTFSHFTNLLGDIIAEPSDAR